MQYQKYLMWRVVWFLLAVLLLPLPAAAAPSSPVPLESWVYPALDKLSGLGLIDSSLQGIRPYSRLEAARQTAEARDRIVARAFPPVAGELLRRLEGEFCEELTFQRVMPPSDFNLTAGPDKVQVPDGTLYIPYALTNTGKNAGSFNLAAADARTGPVAFATEIYADTDRDGRPDSLVPIADSVTVAPGETFPFVVAVPPPAAGDRFSTETVNVTAIGVPPGQSLLQLKLLRELRIAYLYQEGLPSVIANNDARQFALNYNNYGIDYKEQNNGQATFDTEARLGSLFLLNWRPLIETQEETGASLHTLHGGASLGLGPLELSVGRQSLWWGQGRHGALVLTNNAKPLDLVRLTNPSPVLLPWIFKYLGPFRFDTFLSRLEDDRIVPEPYFGGLRINIKPAPWFELGAARTVFFGGEGRPGLGFDDYLTIFGGENLSGEGDTSNSVGAIDFRLKFPVLWGAEFYGELGGEDEADLLGFLPFPSKKALIAGLYLPRIEPSGRLSMRLEYADFNYEDNGPVWYRHGIYPYTYEGKILGHHAGGDSVDYFAEIQAYLPGNIALSAGFDYEKRGESLPVQEEHSQPALEVEWQATPHLQFHARYAYDRVENFGFVQGDDRTFHFASAGVSASW